MSDQDRGVGGQATEWTINVQGRDGRLPTLRDLIGEDHHHISDTEFRQAVVQWTNSYARELERRLMTSSDRSQTLGGNSKLCITTVALVVALLVWDKFVITSQIKEMNNQNAQITTMLMSMVGEGWADHVRVMEPGKVTQRLEAVSSAPPGEDASPAD